MQGNQELVTDPFKRNTSDWLREITQNEDASTNLNDVVTVTGDVSVTQCELLVLELNLKLLLVDIARSVRLSEEVTRVSQHFGVLTIDSADDYWNQQI
ncbi:hypothetical protein F511_33151 [Dorcoceras hygrometricum]|uniref:Uncharacterized protein n=1 Tax=Dorcoceras hygrometricum TaxID=472368 RepID=A0A2Z7C7M9_9LAMI|nr:hypothetical protein F511_33151 [Dorcoceras hygrometricum]